MTDFTQETLSQASDALRSLVDGAPFRSRDFTVDESQTLVVGSPVGLLRSSGRVVLLTNAPLSDTDAGNGAATDFDLGVSDVDAEALIVLIDGAPTLGFSLSAGTGTAGVDQVIFDAAPANATALTFEYRATSDRCIGVCAEAGATAAAASMVKPIIVQGSVFLASIDSPPNHWAAGMTIGSVVLS